MINPQEILEAAERWAMEAEKRENDGDTTDRVVRAATVSQAFSAVALARFVPINELDNIANMIRNSH